MQVRSEAKKLQPHKIGEMSTGELCLLFRLR